MPTQGAVDAPSLTVAALDRRAAPGADRLYGSARRGQPYGLDTDRNGGSAGVRVRARVLGRNAGAVADRFSRSRVVMVANAGSGGVVACLCGAWLAGVVGLPVLVVGTFPMGGFDAVASSVIAVDTVDSESDLETYSLQ